MTDRIPGTSYDNPIWHGKWRIYLEFNPGESRMDFAFVHDDYDGAPDAGDHRHGFGHTVEDCKEQIAEMIEAQP